MKAIIYKDPQQALLVDRPLPQLRDGYILIKTVAIALNPTDWKAVATTAGEDGCLIGVDFAGVVEDVGANVTKPFQKGDRVCGFANGANQLNKEDGAFAEYIVAKDFCSIKIRTRSPLSRLPRWARVCSPSARAYLRRTTVWSWLCPRSLSRSPSMCSFTAEARPQGHWEFSLPSCRLRN